MIRGGRPVQEVGENSGGLAKRDQALKRFENSVHDLHKLFQRLDDVETRKVTRHSHGGDLQQVTAVVCRTADGELQRVPVHWVAGSS